MKIVGQCHCGRVTYQAEIDPQAVSICHCTDCQQLTGSPYRVTVICAGEQIRMTGEAPKIYAKTGDNGRTRFQHFCGECGSPIFTSGEGGPDDWGAGAVSVSASNSNRCGRSGAARPWTGSTTLRNCRGGPGISRKNGSSGARRPSEQDDLVPPQSCPFAALIPSQPLSLHSPVRPCTEGDRKAKDGARVASSAG